jgi:beta-glucanase (GH16 family)
VAVDLSGYKLTFQDEFGSFNRWTGNGSDGTWKTWFYFGDRSLPSNGERQYYMDPDVKGSGSQPLGVNPFSVIADPTQAGDNSLRIEGKPTDPAVKSKIWGYDYTSGLITTEPTFSQTYGYFEMRAKLPEGKGLWSAFWLLPTDKSWPPEIDALEFFGGTNSRGEGGVTEYHWGAIGGKGGWKDVGVDVTQDYHTYGVKWEKDFLTYYFDGQEIAKAPTPADAHKPMYMLANLAIGGNWPESPNGSTKFPANMDIDYIRAYSNDPNATPVGSNPTPTPTPTPAPAPAPAPTPSTGNGGADVTEPTASAAPTNTVANNSTVGTAANDLLNGDYGNLKSFAGGQGDDTYGVGDTGIKIVEKAGEGVDTVSAWLDYTLPNNVENILVGAPYGVKITGNAGANILTGNTGNDTLTGGGGNDLFVMKKGGGTDVVTDFSTADDHVRLEGYGLTDFDAVKAAMTQSGSNVVLNLGTGEQLTFNNHKVADFTAANFVGLSGGVTPPPTPTPTPTPDVTPTPTPTPAPTPGADAGQSTITLHVAEDAWRGDAKFQLVVDGKQVGTDYTVTADHGTAWQDVVVTGDFGAQGPSQVEVKFINDAWGGAAGSDRNLYIDSIEVNGKVFEGEHAAFNSASLKTSPTEAIMEGNGTVGFKTAGAPPAPSATPTPTPDPSGPGNSGGNSGGEVLVNELTASSGKDVFVFADKASHDFLIHDFAADTDVIDVRAALKSAGYSGTDPVADHYLSLVADGTGGTTLMFDADGNGAGEAHKLVTIEHVLPTALKMGTELVWH